MNAPTTLTRCFPALALLGLACGSGAGGSSLTHYGDELSESVAAVRASLSEHHEAVLGETDLQQIRDLERQHMDTMTMRIGRMQDAQDSMMRCSERMGTLGHMGALRSLDDAQGAMAQVMQGATDAMQRHLDAMEAAADVDTALAEERHHQSETDTLVDSMEHHDDELAHAMQTMQDDGMSMMCPMGSHMHRAF